MPGVAFASPSLTASGLVLAGASDGTLHGVNALTGTAVWELDLAAPITSSAAVDEAGRAFVATTDGVVRGLDILSASAFVRWSATPSAGIEASPSLSGEGRLLVPTVDGRLHELRPLVSPAEVADSCEALSQNLSCPCLCEQCSGEFASSFTDVGSFQILACILDGNICSGPVSCYRADACRGAIDISGGPLGLSAAKAAAVGECVEQKCGGCGL